MKEHFWRGPIPRCKQCGVTSLLAQLRQPETRGVGPCPLKEEPAMEHRLIKQWADKVREGVKWTPN